jgi:hypothetical protein
VSRMAELEARRQTLLALCEVQRIELARRIAQLPGDPDRAGAAGAQILRALARPGRHPLAWIATLAALSLLGRTRNVLTLLAWVRTALTLADRVAKVVGIVSALRSRRRERTRARGTARA